MFPLLTFSKHSDGKPAQPAGEASNAKAQPGMAVYPVSVKTSCSYKILRKAGNFSVKAFALWP
jgi:hypothetical protein